jgi:hypothetical protein
MAEEMRRTADFPVLECNIIREELNKAKVNASIMDEWSCGSRADC